MAPLRGTDGGMYTESGSANNVNLLTIQLMAVHIPLVRLATPPETHKGSQKVGVCYVNQILIFYSFLLLLAQRNEY